MTFYLKYRPQSLDDLNLVSVRTSLKKILGSKNVPHAFLFAGPRGTGKTSAARIVAKVINCENVTNAGDSCGKCKQCISIAAGTNIDVIEMDAASHRGIDDIRILKEAVKLAPALAKKKVYIIDEAHMLTTEASNALLKTLEEPPSHVVFILATTNPEKLIDTIRSRTTLIQFNQATDKEIMEVLERIVKSEKIDITIDQLDTILKISRGGFRDAVKTLEQFSLEGYKALGQTHDLKQITSYFFSRNQNELLNTVRDIVKTGSSIEQFIKNLLSYLQNELLIEGTNKKEIIQLLENILEAQSLIKDSPIEELPLQMMIVKWCDFTKSEEIDPKTKWDNSGGGSDDKNKSNRGQVDKLDNADEKNNENTDSLVQINKKEAVSVEPKSDTVAQILESKKKSDNKVSASELSDEMWKKVLSTVKPINATMEALLRSARPENYDGRVLSLSVYYKFHKERIEDIKNKKILEQVLSDVLGNSTFVECNLTDPPVKTINSEVKVETVLTENKDQDIVQIAEKLFSN